MAIDTFTPARDDWTRDDLPGWPVEEVQQIQRMTHAEKLAARLARQGIRKRVTETRIEYRRDENAE